MEDFRGVTLKVGDRIAYATTRSSCVSIIEGEIVEIIEPKPPEETYKWRDEGSLKVKTNQGSRGHQMYPGTDRFKIVTLTAPSRVAKLADYGNPLAKRKY